MKLQLSVNSPKNTILRTPEGQEIYKIVTPRKFGRKVTTITKVVPNLKWDDMHDRFAHLAEIVWPFCGKGTLRFQGFEVPAESYLRPDGLFKRLKFYFSSASLLLLIRTFLSATVSSRDMTAKLIDGILVHSG
jgi:hypothetical protein